MADQCDVLIANGRMIDPANGVDAVRDVALKDGKVSAVGHNLAKLMR